MTIDDLLPDPRNPRTITSQAALGLQASLRAFGDLGMAWNRTTGEMVSGHQRVAALRAEASRRGVDLRVEEHGDHCFIILPLGDGMEERQFYCRIVEMSRAEQNVANLAANNPGIQGEFTADVDVLLAEAQESFPDLYDEMRLGEILAEVEDIPDTTTEGAKDAEPQVDRAAELVRTWGTKRGQVWEIPSNTTPGKSHRVMCGDSTNRENVARLMVGIRGIELLHADPPYGMGKEQDGVINDNLYGEKLDAFQMSWWMTWRPFLADNASAYIWGNAPELWRLWYVGGLADSERMTLRNEIVWDKKCNPGMSSSDMMCYSPAGNERCLFFVMGEQGFNTNADNYWNGWEPIRSALEADCTAMGWGASDIKRICGVGMYSHWFTKSQWLLIPEEHYKKLQAEARGHYAFKRDYDELKRDYDELKRDYDELKRAFYATRAYFDNTHDNMTDVWEFPRVAGPDRHGHATPKPVDMVARAVKSSCPDGGYVAEPFLGSGTTIIAAERVGRICVGAELDPEYVAVILQRATDIGLSPRLIDEAKP